MALVRGAETAAGPSRWLPTHVQVTVLRARGLRGKSSGAGSTSDAYTVIQVGREKYSTSVVEKTLGCPEWREECSFELPPGALDGLLRAQETDAGPAPWAAGSAAACQLVLTTMHRSLIGVDKFLGQAVPYVLARRGGVMNILGATSGDTGSAAEHAFRSRPGVSVFMLSPAGRMSDVQRAQMYSLDDANIHNISVEGVFDDCQNLVKSVNNDADFKQRYSIGAVNSINFGRIAAQCVYYVWSWLRVTDAFTSSARAAEHDSPSFSFAVPSGNFGNIYAGHLARSLGVPIRRLILATNENNVLDEFFRTGVYRPRSSTETLATSSPSMDISKASNLERLVWELLGPKEFHQQWAELERTGVLDLSVHATRLKDDLGFVSGTSTHQDRLAAIHDVSTTHNRLIDPHTADGWTVARKVVEPGETVLVMETAKAEKFGETVAEALGRPAPVSPALRELLALPQNLVSIPADLGGLRDYLAAKAL